MILEIGKDGIVGLQNVHTLDNREMIMVYKGMDITGVTYVKPLAQLAKREYNYLPAYNAGEITLNEGYVISLGYNENIFFVNKEAAVSIFKTINEILI